MAANKGHDEYTDDLEQGSLSGILRAALLNRVEQQEERILRCLVQAHRDGTLTEPQMRGGIAEIAGIRNLLSTLDRDVRKGEEAARYLYS